jgi:hypothetical protein
MEKTHTPIHVYVKYLYLDAKSNPKMKKSTFLLPFLILGVIQLAFSQQKTKGYQIIIDNLGRHVYELWYTKTLDANVTIYRLYNQNDILFSQVEARHLKSSKQIGVLVYCQTDQGTFYEANFEKCSYNEPSLEQFDNPDNSPLIKGKDIPSQLSLQFIDNNYENVKVISVFASRPSIGTYVFYVFPKELNKKEEITNKTLFQGTKVFVDGGQYWKSVVTIDKNIFTVKSYPAKNNSLYKNKNIAKSTESGYIKNGKIYTKSADKKYLPDLYKYEAGKFYELNNENEYNESFEVNNANNTSISNSFTKSNSVSEVTPIALRKFTNLVMPQDDGQKTGKIAVQIKINKKGIVVDATPGVKGTTLNDKELWQKCKDAVMGASLTESETATDIQTGVVVFNFKVK